VESRDVPGTTHADIGLAGTAAPSGTQISLTDLQRTLGNGTVTALVRQATKPAGGMSGTVVQRDEVSDATALLTTGFFHPIVTSTDATKAWDLVKKAGGGLVDAIGKLGAPLVERLLTKLPATAQGGPEFRQALNAASAPTPTKWLESLSRGAGLSALQKQTLKDFMADTKDSEIDLLTLTFEVRFNLTTGTTTKFDAAGLRRSYEVLEALPPAQVEGNAWLKRFNREDTGSGTVSGGDYMNVLNLYTSMTIDYTSGATAMNAPNVSDPGDPLAGVNRFNKVVRHEVGHAVDEKMNWSSGSEPKKASRGAWKEYGLLSGGDVYRAMIKDSGGGISALSKEQQDDVVKDMNWCASNAAGSQLLQRIMARPWWTGLDGSAKSSVQSDDVLKAMATCLVGSHPWYTADGGVALGDRIYQESYSLRWSSYAKEARSRKVSQYQFRAPGEWFAEAYAAYYEPGPKGAVLERSDPDTKAYFDTKVDTQKASLGRGG